MTSWAPFSAGVPRVRVVALDAAAPGRAAASSADGALSTSAEGKAPAQAGIQSRPAAGVLSANVALAERGRGNVYPGLANQSPELPLSASAAPVGRSPGRPRSPSASGPPSLGREVIRIGARATRAAGRTTSTHKQSRQFNPAEGTAGSNHKGV